MKKNSDPTPEQIEQLCREIQSGWSHRERMSRLRADWRPMFTLADGRQQDIEAADYEQHHESSVAYRS
jgi:hypothetical protein